MPILAISSDPRLSDAVLKAGADAFLLKPFQLGQLTQQLYTLILTCIETGMALAPNRRPNRVEYDGMQLHLCSIFATEPVRDAFARLRREIYVVADKQERPHVAWGYPPSYPRPASRARMIACARSTTCNLLKMFET
jgi:hypothetical protein